MNVTDDLDDLDRVPLASVASIIDLARRELPEAATLALGAYASASQGGAELLRRAYALAVDADREYLAELVDLALHQSEAEGVA